MLHKLNNVLNTAAFIFFIFIIIFIFFCNYASALSISQRNTLEVYNTLIRQNVGVDYSISSRINVFNLLKFLFNNILLNYWALLCRLKLPLIYILSRSFEIPMHSGKFFILKDSPKHCVLPDPCLQIFQEPSLIFMTIKMLSTYFYNSP